MTSIWHHLGTSPKSISKIRTEYPKGPPPLNKFHRIQGCFRLGSQKLSMEDTEYLWYPLEDNQQEVLIPSGKTDVRPGLR